MSYFILFSYRSRVHLNLHSFPTRRSSDLHCGPRVPAFSSASAGTLSPKRLIGPRNKTTSDGGSDERSEEHTSELQSRRDLVCRLLLEKKKKNKYIITNTH